METVVKVNVGKEIADKGEWESLDYLDLENFIAIAYPCVETMERYELVMPVDDGERDRIVQDMIELLVREGSAERIGENAVVITDRRKHFEAKWDGFRKEAEKIAALDRDSFAEMSVSGDDGKTAMGNLINSLTEAWSNRYGLCWFDEDGGIPHSIDEYMGGYLRNGDVVTFGDAVHTE